MTRRKKPTATAAMGRAALSDIATMRDTLNMARALVTAGREIDLNGLEDEAAALCRAVSALPPGSAEEVLPAMRALVREVEALAATLRAP